MTDTLKNKGSNRESNRGVENSLKFISNKQRLLMLILIIILIISPLMLNPIDDAGAHIARIEYLQDNIQNLGIFGAMHSKVYFGMVRDAGYGYPMFYGDILLYPFATLLSLQKALGFDKQVGLDAYTLYRVVLSMQFIGVFFSSYIAANKFLKHHIEEIEIPYNVDRKDLQLLIGFLYTVMPYTIMNLHNQAYRIVATVIIPWVIYNAFEIYLQSDKRSVKRNTVWLAITMSLVILTHLIQAVYVSAVLIAFIIYEVIANGKLNVKAVIKYLTSAGICIVLVAQFIIPMLIALSSEVYAVSNTQYNLSGQYNTTLIGLFFPEWIVVTVLQILGIPDSEIIHYGQTGYYGFYYLILLIFGVKFIVPGIMTDGTEQQSKIDNRTQGLKLGLMCIAYTIVYAIICFTGAFQKLIEFTQFRYRLNTVFDCGLIYLIIKILLYNIEYTGILEKDKVTLNNSKNSGLNIQEKEIGKFNKERKNLLNYLVTIGYITIALQILYSSMLNIGRGELGIQVGGGGEYLVYNKLYDEYDENKVAALQYNTQNQIIDLTNYIDTFKDNENVEYLNKNGKIKEYTITNVQQTIKNLRNTTEKIINNREKETGRKVDEIQSISSNSLVLPINYYPGYEITITSDDSSRSIEVGNIDKVDLEKHFIDNGKDFKVSNLGLIQIDLTDSEINSQKIEVNVKYTGTTLDNITFIIQFITWVVVAIAIIWIEVDKRNKRIHIECN